MNATVSIEKAIDININHLRFFTKSFLNFFFSDEHSVAGDMQ